MLGLGEVEDNIDVSNEEVVKYLRSGSIESFKHFITGNMDDENIFRLLLENDGISINTSRDAFRYFNSKLSAIPISSCLYFLKAFSNSISSRKLHNFTFDTLDACLSAIRIYKNIEKISSTHIILGYIEKLLKCSLNEENILPLIVTLRTFQDHLNEVAFNAILKRVEDIPVKQIPAAMYQVLLLSKENPQYINLSFESIFAIFDSLSTTTNNKTIDTIDTGECLIFIKLALNHESKINSAFQKYFNNVLKMMSDPNPFLILLSLSSCNFIEIDVVIPVLNYLKKLDSFHRRLYGIGKVPDLDHDSVPRADKVLKRLAAVVQSDDETSLKAIISLGLKLLKLKPGEDNLISSGKDLLKTIYQKFPSTRMEISSLIVEVIFLSSDHHQQPLHLATFMESIELISTIDEGKILLELFTSKSSSYELALFSTLEQLDIRHSSLYLFFANRLLQRPEYTQTCPILTPNAILLKLIHQESIPRSLHGFLQASLKGSGKKQNFYRFISSLIQSKDLDYHPCGLAILVRQLSLLRPDDNYTDWPMILQRCDNEISEPLMDLLSVISLYAKVGSDDKVMKACGILDNLCETLCHKVEWFDATPTILGLYKIAFTWCAKNSELSTREKMEAMGKICAQETQFSSDNPNISSEVEKLMLLQDAYNVLTLCLAECKHSSFEPVILSLLSVKWNFKYAIDWNSEPLISLLLDLLLHMNHADNCDILSKKKISSLCIQKLHSLKSIVNPSTLLVEKLVVILHTSLSADINAKDLWILSNVVLEAILSQKNEIQRDSEISKRLFEMCRNTVCTSDSEITLGKNILSSLLPLNQHNPHVIEKVSREILFVAGRLDGGELEQRQSTIKMFSSKSLDPLLNIMLTTFNNQVSECEWILDQATIICKTLPLKMTAIISYLCTRLSIISASCEILAQANISGNNYYKMMELFKALIHLASTLAKVMLTMKLPITVEFTQLATNLANYLTRQIYLMLPVVQQNELELLKELAGHKKKKKNVSKKYTSRLGREARVIPQLIFQIEAFERGIIALNDLHKVRIVKSFQRSTARDFRIQLDELEEALANNDTLNTTNEDVTDATEDDPGNAGATTEISLLISNL